MQAWAIDDCTAPVQIGPGQVKTDFLAFDNTPAVYAGGFPIRCMLMGAQGLPPPKTPSLWRWLTS
jgi:hypothetical protein